MTKRSGLFTAVFAAAGMLILILDSKTALQGAQEGVMLCMRTVIPCLFPFFFLSNILSSTIMGRSIPLLRPLGRLCRIPEGAEYILIIGFLGGYPVGAKCISDLLAHRSLTTESARRMLGFCNNCGPAFLFGMSSVLFDAWYVPWLLLIIQFFSAVAVGMILPGGGGECVSRKMKNASIVSSLKQAISSIAAVCGWVLLFKTLLIFLNRWIMWFFPIEIQVLISGLLELSNGCIGLNDIENARLRFILCSGFLSFGGLCAAMQTLIVSAGVDTGLYFPGKVLQCCIALTMAMLLCGLNYWMFPAVFAAALSLFLQKKQKIGRNLQTVDV